MNEERTEERPEPRAWVEMLSEDQARRVLPESYGYDHGLLPSFFRLVQTHERIGDVFWPLQAAVMQGGEDSELSQRDRELIAVVAAVAQDCEY